LFDTGGILQFLAAPAISIVTISHTKDYWALYCL